MSSKKPAKYQILGSYFNELIGYIEKCAQARKSILLIGPRGTGKELFARVYQEASGKNTFMPVNCAGIPDTALISELFGHAKGVYTGATAIR